MKRIRLALAAVLLTGLTACSTPVLEAPVVPESPSGTASAVAPEPSIQEKSEAPEPKAEQGPAAGTALEQLATIEVKGRAPKTGYSRDQFGNGWKDPDRNGCDARNDILARDLTNEVLKAGGCVVLSGKLADPFTATTINFIRGNKTSTAVQIDHVVPLSDAWQKGAQQLAPNQREAFANDPLNLLAVDGPTNGSKSDSDAATWLPPNKAFRCEYVALQTAVKAKYQLWMTKAERQAIKNILSTSCPDQPVPAGGGAAVPVAVAPAPAQKPKPAPVKEAPARAPAGGNVFYQNCTAVKDAGAAPIRAGDPGWDTKFDRDGDGVGCES
ncbi:MAG: GmrSD restriction endonuclease domain-containing protein [Actinomycetota bacterium]